MVLCMQPIRNHKKMIKCFFLDRDGVLIKNYGYFCDKDKIKWLNGAFETIKILNEKK